jgi:RNA polymerase-binding transcription factor DksA
MATSATLTPRGDLDLKKFRRLLDAEQQRIETELKRIDALDETGGASGELSELADYDQHPGDQGTELFFREQDEAIESALKEELGQVQVAMRKLDDGTYGYCQRCEAEIPKERLEVLPAAGYCIRCASEVV